MSSRADVYRAIDRERDYQERTWDRSMGPVLSVAEELLLAQEYLDRARHEWSVEEGNAKTLDMMRKVAGILVRCFEHNGCPERPPFEVEGQRIHDDIVETAQLCATETCDPEFVRDLLDRNSYY